MSLSFNSISTGVRAMVTATAAMSGAVTSSGITLFCEAKENSTNANSPPCASEKANRKFWSSPMPNTRPSTMSTTNLIAIRPATSPRISSGELAIRSKSIEAPTAMKNTASSRPLKGSISLSSSCRYSLLASTTPARKVPRAGLSPTRLISRAIPMISSSAVAVNSSRSRVPAMTRNTGRSR